MIGVFDSGYGGLTILRSILERLPSYDYVFLGDNARAPYGARSHEVIYQFTLQGIKYLFELGCPLVVLACNTASARALRRIQQQYLPVHYPDRRVLGVIRPSAESLATIPVGDVDNFPKPEIKGKVGILGTRATIQSESYVLELNKLAPNLEVYQQPCPIWVPLVEAGEITGSGTEYFVEQSLHQLFEQCSEPDRLLLACTHYNVLLPIIRKFVPQQIDVLTQEPIIAERLADWLIRHPEFEQRLSKEGDRLYLTTDDAENFSNIGANIMPSRFKTKTVTLDRTGSL
jgi:glutamate racemase